MAKPPCNVCFIEEYTGESISLDRVIDGKNQEFEVYILDNIESEKMNLFINGTHSEIEIVINYCPICGRKL